MSSTAVTTHDYMDHAFSIGCVPVVYVEYMCTGVYLIRSEKLLMHHSEARCAADCGRDLARHKLNGTETSL